MLRFLLFPFSFIYSLFSRLRNFLYNNNLFKSKYFHNTKIISIGNITVGGTGKTPHTEFFAKKLSKKFNNIAILSRGYRRKTKGFLYVNKNTSVANTGDEPMQMALKLKNITVAVSENRVEGCKRLISEKKSDIIILDDAFQHRRIKPKVSILLTNYNNPFFKDYFLPVGKLRDNKSEYYRADIIIISNSPTDLRPIEKKIWFDNIGLFPYQKLFFSSIKYSEHLINIFNRQIKIPLNDIKNQKIILVSGISNNRRFFDYIKKFTEKIIFFNFIDHKNYKKNDIKKIISEFDKADKNIFILTTEKDAVKLSEIDFPQKMKKNMFFLPIEIKILFNEEEKLLQETIQLLEK